MIYILISVNVYITMITASAPQWDIFTFTQEWPEAVCIKGREEHHKCTIPPGVHGWGIHGLWPTKIGTRGPEECNKDRPFNVDSIQSLLPHMRLTWPNMYSDTSEDSFWEHEWTKHGTCASTLAATSTEYNYFSTALGLYEKYNGLRLLSNQGIVPSNTSTYWLNATEAALKRELGVNSLVQCTFDQATRRQILYELEICLNKDLDPVDCYPDEKTDNNSGAPSSGHKYNKRPVSSCPTHYQFHYPPLPDNYRPKIVSG